MKDYSAYWIATLIRGIVAILAGTAVLFIPQVAWSVFLIPFTIVTTILCLAAYGILDSAVVLATSFTLPGARFAGWALALQGICGFIIGILLFTLVSVRINLSWFIYLAAMQASGAAATEWIVARRTALHHRTKWCYASCIVAAVSAVALVSGRHLDPHELAWLIYGYLGVFGFALVILASRMLFADRQALREEKLKLQALAASSLLDSRFG